MSTSSVRISVKVKTRPCTDGSNQSLDKMEEINENTQHVDTMTITSPEAMGFIDTIKDSDFELLLFSDHLITTSDMGRHLGDFVVSIEEGKYDGQECFVIHANSHGSIDAVPCGTSIEAHVNRQLQTLHQQHHEYVKLINCPLDRKTTIISQEGKLTLNRVISQGDDVTKINKDFTKEQVQGFISEGSNLLLHRLLIAKGIPTDCTFISFDSDLNLCAASYRRLEEKLQNVDEIQVKVYGIERTIHSHADLPTSWQSYFTHDGFLAHRVQVGSPVVMKLAKFPQPLAKDEEAAKPIFNKAGIDWFQDMQLFSMFMDKKEELKGQHGQYVREHPDLKSILADFLQYLLLHKPRDVIAFAAEYFTSFSAAMPQPNTFATTSNATPYSMSRASTKLNELRDESSKSEA